jgi:hypothetical protein
LVVTAKRQPKNSVKVKSEVQSALQALLVVAPARALGAEATSDVDVMDVHIHSYRSSSVLRFYGEKLGTRCSRRHRYSWLMVRTGTHMRPARCEAFIEAEVRCTHHLIQQTSSRPH